MKNIGSLKIVRRTDLEVVMTRAFDAPRNLVYDALTKPELLKRWLSGPPGPGWSMPVCEVDLKVGGSYRFVWRNTDGSELSMRGVYREIAPPERLVNTESFVLGVDVLVGEQLATSVLTEQAGRTTLTTTILYSSKEARDAIFGADMERGVIASYDRLDEVLASGVAGVAFSGNA